MANDLGREFSWDDTLDENADVFTLLDPGEYDFQVMEMARVRYGGSAKLPSCWQAKLKLLIDGVTVEHNLFLHSKCEGLLCAFFKGIGARKTGERIHMDWNRVPGATGRCVVAIRSWTGKDGQERKSNDITKFIPAEDMGAPQQPQAAAPVAMAGEVVDDMPF